MINEISRNKSLYKVLFLILGFVLIVFCFFFNVSELENSVTQIKYYYTFSARIHTAFDGKDCYQDIYGCLDDGFCKTTKSTPYLGGFALGFMGLVLLISAGESILSKKIKKYHIWIIQLIMILIAWALILIIPILYLSTKENIWKLSWLPILFEFGAVIATMISAFLYFLSNESMGPRILS